MEIKECKKDMVVKCIDDSGCRAFITMNHLYVVAEVGDFGIKLFGVDPTKWWHPDRFEATEMIESNKVEIGIDGPIVGFIGDAKLTLTGDEIPKDKLVSIDQDLKYLLLWNTLRDAWDQAANGKGKERHQKDDEPFEDQPICAFARRVGLGYPLGQAMKKIDEASRMEPEAAVMEILGAINYLAAAVIVIRERMENAE